jgi:hypothetical protein
MRTLTVLAWLLLVADAHGNERPWAWRVTESRWSWTITERPVQPVVMQPIIQPQPIYWSHPVEARPTMPMRWSGFSRGSNC